jgi:hypothetical protein
MPEESALTSSLEKLSIDTAGEGGKKGKGKNPIKTAQRENATDDQDESTEGKREGGRSIFLKVHNETYVHHTLFKDLLTIVSDKAPSGKFNLQLGFRDGRQVFSVVEEPELAKLTKRMKEYAKSDKSETTEQKGRSTFLKIHHETYVHHSLFKELVTISSNEETTGVSTLQLGFRDGRQVDTGIDTEDELKRVVKRVKEFAKKYGNAGSQSSAASGAEESSVEDSSASVDGGKNSHKKKKEKTSTKEDGAVASV